MSRALFGQAGNGIEHGHRVLLVAGRFDVRAGKEKVALTEFANPPKAWFSAPERLQPRANANDVGAI